MFNLVGFEQYDRKLFKEEQEAAKYAASAIPPLLCFLYVVHPAHHVRMYMCGLRVERLTTRPKPKKWEDKVKRRNGTFLYRRWAGHTVADVQVCLRMLLQWWWVPRIRWRSFQRKTFR